MLLDADRGLAYRQLDLFELHQKDAWERASRIIAMVHNTTRTNAQECKPPAHFNDLASARQRAGNESTGGERDDYPWAEPEPVKNGEPEKY